MTHFAECLPLLIRVDQINIFYDRTGLQKVVVVHCRGHSLTFLHEPKKDLEFFDDVDLRMKLNLEKVY